MDVTEIGVRGWVVVAMGMMVSACGGGGGGLAAATAANAPPAVSGTRPPTTPTTTTPSTTPSNGSPSISGTPGTAVLLGTPYTFTPTSQDANGDTLRYSIVNAPPWASFDTATGRLSGTPGPEHVGATNGIVISVSDGEHTVSLAAFGLTVQAVATGTAALSWHPPTTNTDGSPVTNLAGYKVYWGSSAGSYPHSVTLDNPGLTAYVVTNLVPGTWFFAATALNSSGAESAHSSLASKTIH